MSRWGIDERIAVGHTRDMNTATITVTTGNTHTRKVVASTQVSFEGLVDRRAARDLARAHASTVKGQAVEVAFPEAGILHRFSHSEVSA